MHLINYKIVIFLMGVLLMFNGGSMLFSALTSFLMKDGATFEIALSAFITLSVGVLMILTMRQHSKELNKREGYLIVSLGWLLMSISGTLPYLLTGAIPDFFSSFFETVSGYTTTGATILDNIESLPAGILFWRSTTHWIGGMGIIVLTIAVLPLLGIGGMQLFAAEAPGPNTDKLHPRITDTAKRLWLIYLIYTLLETVLLKIAGMSLFDAINHAMSTLSTGGFSTKNDSVAHWNRNPIIGYIITFFMILAGSNFVLSYFAFKGKVQKIMRDDEFKAYIFFIFLFSSLSACVIYTQVNLAENAFEHPQVLGKLESALRHGLFQVVAVVTTTGFSTSDFTQWTPLLAIVFLGLMFLGGSAGSTSGGIKVVRHLLMIKGGILEFKRALHPNAILQARYNGKLISNANSHNILGFFILYMLTFIIGAIGFGFLGISFDSSIGLSASSLGNVGPALGDFGPSDNYAALPNLGKLWAAFLMLLGRLELFTLMILFTPFFWKKH